MSITKDEFKHLTKLCAIKTDEAQTEKLMGQINNIVEFVSELQKVDVEGIQPMSHPIEDKTLDPRTGSKDSGFRDDMLKNVRHQVKDHGIVIKSPIKG